MDQLKFFLSICVGLVIWFAVGMFLDDVAASFGIRTDLGYEVCDDTGGGRQTWESCTSRTAAGQILGLISMGIGWLGGYGLWRLTEDWQITRAGRLDRDINKAYLSGDRDLHSRLCREKYSPGQGKVEADSDR